MHCLHERVGRFMQEHLEEMSIDNQNCNLFPFFWSCEAWRPLDNLIRVREILQLARATKSSTAGSHVIPRSEISRQEARARQYKFFTFSIILLFSLFFAYFKGR